MLFSKEKNPTILRQPESKDPKAGQNKRPFWANAAQLFTQGNHYIKPKGGNPHDCTGLHVDRSRISPQRAPFFSLPTRVHHYQRPLLGARAALMLQDFIAGSGAKLPGLQNGIWQTATALEKMKADVHDIV
jgi:hypothetical protein